MHKALRTDLTQKKKKQQTMLFSVTLIYRTLQLKKDSSFSPLP